MVRRSAFGTAYIPAATSSDSFGVKNGSAAISCGTTPMAARASRGLASMSRPQIETWPDVLRQSPARMLKMPKCSGSVSCPPCDSTPKAQRSS